MVKTRLVIFGITGDLAARKLLPALDSIVATDSYADLSIVGVSRRQIDEDSLLQAHPALKSRTKVFSMDLAHEPEYERLKSFLESNPVDQTLFYLAVPPGAASDIVSFLGKVGLNTPAYKVLFEKPFGFDLLSAQDFIQRTAAYFSEDQLYRIDHYMGKEIAAELLHLRHNAENQHHYWNNQSVKAITVMATETIGIEGRAQFYEQTGALRDFVQGHLFQLLALVLMQSPHPIDLPAQRLVALQKLSPVVPAHAARAQYEGYQHEVQNPGSMTETFVDFIIESVDPAWHGVAIRVLTGKALHERRSCVKVTYIDGKEDVFDEAALASREGQRLDAYERVIIEAIEGRKGIFTSSQEVIRSWELLAPLQESWAMEMKPLLIYPKGAHAMTVVVH